MLYRFVLLSFLLIICMNSVAHCSFLEDIIDRDTIPDITGIDLVTVSGILDCGPPPPRDEPTLPAGVKVSFTCDGGRTIISDAITDTTGFFKITFNTLLTSLFHPNQCDDCRIAARGAYAASCAVFPGHRGALLAPIDCRNPTVHQLHGDHEQGGKAVEYKANSFYYDPSY